MHKDSKEPLIDFDTLSQKEKIPSIKKNKVWFGFVGASSNFMSNNFDPLILLSLFGLKYFLMRIFVQGLKKKLTCLKSIKIKLFLSKLST